MTKAKPLRILHAACHGPTLTKRHVMSALWRYRADSIGWTEAYHLVPYMRTRKRWRLAVGSKDRAARGAWDNPILTRKRNKVLEVGAAKACEASTPARIAPERWVTWSAFQHDVGLVLHIALHPNAGVSSDKAWKSDRAAKYRQTLAAVEALVVRMRATYPGLHVVVTGDLNYHPNDPVREGSPRDLFTRLGLRWWGQGLDWVAYSDGLKLGAHKVIPQTKNGQDHPWLLASLTLA